MSTKPSEAAALIPKFLSHLGMKQVIAPLPTKTDELWTNLGSYKVSLYPYVEGRNGIETRLSDPQWIEFGATIKRLHKADIPPTIASGIPRETFPTKWRQTVKTFLERIEKEVFSEPTAVAMASFLKSKSREIHDLVWN